MSDVLDRIRAKVARAKQHLDDFDAELCAFYNTNPYRVDFKEHPDVGNRTYHIAKADPVPFFLESIAADVLTNLRAPLDHIAHQAVLRTSSGPVPQKPVFYYPVCATANDYKSTRCKVQTMQEDILQAIDRTEPYQGGKGHALWQLNELNKLDKHQLLLSAGAAYMSALFSRSFFEAMGIHRPMANLFLGMNNETVKVGQALPIFESLDVEPKSQSDFMFHVTFADVGVCKCEPATETLHNIANLVSEIVDTIGPAL